MGFFDRFLGNYESAYGGVDAAQDQQARTRSINDAGLASLLQIIQSQGQNPIGTLAGNFLSSRSRYSEAIDMMAKQNADRVREEEMMNLRKESERRAQENLDLSRRNQEFREGVHKSNQEQLAVESFLEREEGQKASERLNDTINSLIPVWQSQGKSEEDIRAAVLEMQGTGNISKGIDSLHSNTVENRQVQENEFNQSATRQRLRNEGVRIGQSEEAADRAEANFNRAVDKDEDSRFNDWVDKNGRDIVTEQLLERIEANTPESAELLSKLGIKPEQFKGEDAAGIRDIVKTAHEYNPEVFSLRDIDPTIVNNRFKSDMSRKEAMSRLEEPVQAGESPVDTSDPQTQAAVEYLGKKDANGSLALGAHDIAKVSIESAQEAGGKITEQDIEETIALMKLSGHDDTTTELFRQIMMQEIANWGLPGKPIWMDE